MRRTGYVGRNGWTPNRLSKERGSVFLGRHSCASLLDVGRSAEQPFFAHAVMRGEYGRESWFEHGNYFHYSLEIPLAGSLLMRQRDVESVVRPGSVYIIHQGEDAYMESGPEGFCRKLSVLVNGYMAQSFMCRTGLSEHLEIALSEPDSFVKSVCALESMLKEKDEAAIPEICGATLALLLRLANEIDAGRPELLRKALGVMQANLARPVSIAGVADALSTSAATLTRLFRKHLGVSPKRHYLDLRMEKAAILLRESKLPVKGVAAESGFKSPVFFAAEFKRRHGVPPRDFRRANAAS